MLQITMMLTYSVIPNTLRYSRLETSRKIQAKLMLILCRLWTPSIENGSREINHITKVIAFSCVIQSLGRMYAVCAGCAQYAQDVRSMRMDESLLLTEFLINILYLLVWSLRLQYLSNCCYKFRITNITHWSKILILDFFSFVSISSRFNESYYYYYYY